MSGPIQPSPIGLLGLLSLKNLGKNPKDLIDTVQPAFDLRELYTSQLIEVSVGAFAGAAIGDNAVGPQVPQNEAWFVHHVVAESDALAAGEIIVISPSYRPRDFVTVPLCPTDDSVRFAGTAGLPRVASLQPFIAPPGSRFGVYVAFLSGPVNVQCTVVFARARV